MTNRNDRALQIVSVNTFVPPTLNNTIVQKILHRETSLEKTEKEIYDILTQSIDRDIDDPTGYYSRAYKVNPTMIRNLYDRYHNTDHEDLGDILNTIEKKLHKYDVKCGYLRNKNDNNRKKIIPGKDVCKLVSDYIHEDTTKSIAKYILSLGKENYFDIYITIQPEGLRLLMGVSINMEEDVCFEDDEEKPDTLYYRKLYFKDIQAQLDFIRSRIGEEGDIMDNISYV